MSIVTTYTCDKCNHEQDNSEEPRQLWDLGIRLKEKRSHYTQFLESNKETVLWCRSCVVKLGLLPATADDPPVPHKKPTFEEVLREIIQDELSDFNP